MKIERVDGLKFGRAYKVFLPDGPVFLPSVTTVLSVIPDPYLEMLRLELGDKLLEKKRNDGAARGSVMHRWLELFLDKYSQCKDHEESLLYTQDQIIIDPMFEKWSKTYMDKGRNLFYNFYGKKFWKRIDKVLHNELFMYTQFRGGWAGATDFIFEDTDGNLILQDFKSSTLMKEKEKISKYFYQVAAYMFMYSEMYGRTPKRGEIVVSNELNDEIQTFIVDASEMKGYIRTFIEARNEFEKIPEWQEFKEKNNTYAAV